MPVQYDILSTRGTFHQNKSIVREGNGVAKNSRETILMAATKIFLKKGFEKTTMADIAKQANVTQPAIYVHFKDKMDLMKSVCQWSAERGRTFIDEYIDETAPVSQRFESYVLGNLEFFKSETELAHSIMAMYYFALTHKEIKTVLADVQNEATRRIELFIFSGNHEGAWTVKKTAATASKIHSFLVGECYKAIYFVDQKDLTAFAKSTWSVINGQLKSI